MSGIAMIQMERQRQVTEEGWTFEHDDRCGAGALLAAAECYRRGIKLTTWPWTAKWWKPKSKYRNLVRAGALAQAAADVALRLRNSIAAEIDQIPASDRTA